MQKFFGPRLGPKVVATRCRLVNRCFGAEEGQPHELMKTLDQNVTVIDPRKAEEAFARDYAGVRTMEEAERVAAESLARRLERKEDVPPVEDFPLAPTRETLRGDPLERLAMCGSINAGFRPLAAGTSG